MRIIVAQFISKYVTSPNPSIHKMNNLQSLDLLLMDPYEDIDSHMDEINFNHNKVMLTFMETHLYIRALNYGSDAISFLARHDVLELTEDNDQSI